MAISISAQQIGLAYTKVANAGFISSMYVIIVPMPSLMTITSTSFPNGTINVQYPTQTLTATGGFAPYTWSASGLPPGLAISGATIVGTPTSAGTFQFTLSVFDSQTNTATRQLSIIISAATPAWNASLIRGFPLARRALRV